MFIQALDQEGEEIIPSEELVRGLTVVIEPQPVGERLKMLADGLFHLSFTWRQVGQAEIGIVSVDAQGRQHHIAHSPYQVLVEEPYEVRISGEPQLSPILAANRSDDRNGWRGDTSRRFSYVTILTNDAFCSGALVMQHTLLETQTKYPEVLCLVTKSVTESCRQLLQHAGLRLQEVSILGNPNVRHKAHFADVYSKLHVFSLAQFDKVVYLDSDMMVLNNIDHLFDSYPALSAAPEINPPALFNSGLMVLAPSKELYESLLAAAPLLPSYDKTDQGFLNEMWIGNWNMLPYTYNFLKDRGALPDRFDSFVARDLSEVYVVHMVGEKPWHCRHDHECNSQGRLSSRLWGLWKEKFQHMCARTERPLACKHRSLLL